MITREKNLEVEVEGLKIGMRFDNWALKEAQNKTACKGIMELFNRVAEADAEALIVIIMEAVNEYNHFIKKDEKIDLRKASEYIDLMGGAVKVVTIIPEALKQFQSPNLTPPEASGETSQ